MLPDGDTKDLQIHSGARESRRQSQGWGVLASHLASLASFETELSISLANNNKSNALHYLWFQQALKSPLLLGARPQELHWLQAAQLEPLLGHFHRCSRKCLCAEFTWSAGAGTAFTGCSAHHPQSGLERSGFPMISQDNAGITGRVSLLSTCLVTNYTHRKLIRYSDCSGRKLSHTYFSYQVQEKKHKNCA